MCPIAHNRRPAIHSRSPNPTAAARVPLVIATARGAPPSRIGSVKARWTGASNPGIGISLIRPPLRRRRRKTKEERTRCKRDGEAEHDLDEAAESAGGVAKGKRQSGDDDDDHRHN